MHEKNKPSIETRDKAVQAAQLALDKKALDVRVLDIGRISSIADYLVLASGASDRQVQAIVESVRKGLKKYGKVQDVEGLREGNWVVMDYGDILVHVFQQEVRRYYDLDGLWQDAATVDVPEPPPHGTEK